MKYYLGIDLGGTNIAVGVVDESYTLLKKKSAPTPKDADGLAIAQAIREVSFALLGEMDIAPAQVECAGIGTPGQVNSETGLVIFACNLGMRNVPLGDQVTKELGIRTYLCNDADAAAFGEHVAGAAKGSRSSVTVTLGTGVGVGVIINNTIIPGEGGHMVMVHNGIPCNCGRKGCIESYASATALIRQTKEAMEQDKSSLMWQVADGSLDKVGGRTLFQAMQQGDATAKKVFETYVDYVACTLSRMGAASSSPSPLMPPPMQYPLATQELSRVEICQLGNDAGIIGAALFGKYL